MDSLAGQQLVKADGASVNADEALANKVYFPFRQDQVFFLTRSVCFLSDRISFSLSDKISLLTQI